MRARLIASAALLTSGAACAQTSSNLVPGQSYPATIFNPLFAGKADVSNGTLTNPTITGGSAAGTNVSQALVNGQTVQAALAAIAAQAASAGGGTGLTVSQVGLLTSALQPTTDIASQPITVSGSQTTVGAALVNATAAAAAAQTTASAAAPAAALTSETTRAEGAESTNATALAAETNRAESVETTLAKTSSLGTAAFAATGTAVGNVPVVQSNGLLSPSVVPSSGSATVTSSSISGAGGLIGTNNLSDLSAPSTARTNLGLGTAALANTGAGVGNVPVLGTGGILPIATNQAITTSTTLPYSVFIGTATANLANLIPSANVAQQFGSGRVSLYMHNSGMALLTSAQRTALAATWASVGVGGVGNQGMGEISQFSSQAAADGEKGNFPGGVFPGEVNIDVTPTGSYTTSTSNGDTTSGTVYPGFYSSSDVSAIEASIGYAAVDGAKNAAIFATPNSLTQDLADPFATSSYWAPVRALALYGGGLAIDTPPTFFFYTGTPAYRSMVLQQVAWAKTQGLRVVFVVSPYPINGAATDTSFLANTEALAGYLEAQGDAPTEWVVENYSNPSNGTNDVTSDTDVANSVNQVALYLARSAPIAAASTVAGTFSGSVAQASLNASGTKIATAYTGTTHQGTQITPADNAGSSTLGGQSAGDVGISGGVIVNTGIGSTPYLTMNGPISGATTLTSGLVSLNGNLGTTGIPTTSGLMGVLGWNYSAGLGELDTINLHSTATSSMRWYQLTSGGTYSLLGSLSTSGLSVAGPVSDANGVLAEQSAVTTETSRAQAAEALKAPTASPALTGTPTVPTASAGTNTTQIASTAFVASAVSGVSGSSSPATNSSAGTVQPDTTSTAIANGKLSAIALAGGSNYVTIPAASSTVISTPSSTANQLPADKTEVIDLTISETAYPASGKYPQIVGAWGGSSSNSSFDIYQGSTGTLTLGYYAAGNGTFQSTNLATTPLPLTTKGTLSLILNSGTSGNVVAHGFTVVPQAVEAVFQTAGSSTWTVLGSGTVNAGGGINRLGASQAALQIGDASTSDGGAGMQVFGMVAYDGLSQGSILANVAISNANTGTIPTDSVGNVWTTGGALTISGTQNLTPIATPTALGMIQVGTDGSIAINPTTGVLTANLAQAYTTPSVAPWTGQSHSSCARQQLGGFSPTDWGASGAGYSQTIGTQFGTTLSAVAGYTITDCSGHSYQPFAWLTDGTYHGGVQWNVTPGPAQDWTNHDVVTGSLPYNTTGSVAVANVSNVAPGMSVYDFPDGASIGVPISAVAAETVTSTAALSTVVAVGDTLMDGVTRQTAIVTAVSGTSYTLVASAPLFIAGHTLVDTTSSAIGSISSVTPPTISFASATAHSLNPGDEIVIQQQTTTTAAGSTTSATLSLAASANAVAGNTVFDTTLNKVLGTVSSISGTTLTLSANALAAAASGDLIDLYPGNILPWMIATSRTGYPSHASYHAPYWELASNASFYPQIGDLITDASNSTPCIASGTTISGLDSDPHDVNWGQVTLSAATTYDCPGNTKFLVRIPDSAVANLDVDWFGIQSAIFAATQTPQDENVLGGGAAYRKVNLPDGALYPQRPIFAYSYTSNPGQHIIIQGTGTTMLVQGTDFGYGKFAVTEGSSGGVSQYGNGVLFRDFELVGPGSGSGVGTDPSHDYGLGMGAGDVASFMTVQGFHAGFAFQGDHTQVFNSGASGNYYGIYFAPDVGSIGNQRIENDVLVANRFASVGIAYSNQFDSGTVLDTHVGFDPVGWYKEAPGFFDPYETGNGFITNSSLHDNWWEATGNGAIIDASETSQLNSNLFAGAETNNDVQYGGDALSNMYPGGKAEATIHVGSAVGNRFIGATILSDYANVAKDVFDVVGICTGNQFFGAEAFVGGNTSAVPGMECGQDGGQNAFDGAWRGLLHLTDGTVYSGSPVAIDSAGKIVSYNTSSATGYEGTGGGASANITTICASGQNQMCPVIQSGTNVPYVAGGSVTMGTLLTPTSSGSSPTSSYVSTGTLSGALGTASNGNPGSNQIGLGDFR